MHKHTLSAVAAATALSFVAACASSTVIRSNPSGAKVFLDGAYVGNTPYTMSDTKIVGSTTRVHLEYPGYQPLETSISRSEEFDALACVGGLFLLVPFLWIEKYHATHDYILQPGGGGGYPAGGAYPGGAAPAPYPGQPAPQPYPPR